MGLLEKICYTIGRYKAEKRMKNMISKWNNMKNNLEYKHITQNGKYDLDKVELKAVLTNEIIEGYIRDLKTETLKIHDEDPEFYELCNRLLKNLKGIEQTFDELIEGERTKYQAMMDMFSITYNTDNKDIPTD